MLRHACGLHGDVRSTGKAYDLLIRLLTLPLLHDVASSFSRISTIPMVLWSGQVKGAASRAAWSPSTRSWNRLLRWHSLRVPARPAQLRFEASIIRRSYDPHLVGRWRSICNNLPLFNNPLGRLQVFRHSSKLCLDQTCCCRRYASRQTSLYVFSCSTTCRPRLRAKDNARIRTTARPARCII